MKILVLWLLLAPLPLWAGLTFEKTLKEVQAGYDQREVTCDFEFTNETDQPVSIARYESTCSCMSVKVKDGKLLYQPGEKGTIRAIFDMGNFAGDVDKAVRLWLKGDPAENPSVLLTTRVHIPVLVGIEPKTVRWEVDPDGEPETKVIEIRMNHEEPIHVLSVQAGNEKFDVELKTIKDGREYDLLVTPKSVAEPALAVIQIRTDAKSSRHATQRAFALVRQPVEEP